jgi:hypothetical protein
MISAPAAGSSALRSASARALLIGLRNRVPAAESNTGLPGARKYYTSVPHPAAIVEWDFDETLH